MRLADDLPRSAPGWSRVAGRRSSSTRASELDRRGGSIGQLRACEVVGARVLPAARALGAGRGASPSTAGARQAALRHAADRVETALAGLEEPLGRYLLELEADRAEGRSWYGGPGRRRARRLASRCSTAPASTRRRDRVAPAISSWPCSCARSRGSRTRRALEVDARPRLALGGPVRPARQPARLDASTTCAPSPPSNDCRSRWRPSITVVGSVNLDLVARGERLPRPGETVTGGDVRARPGRQGREPGRRVRAARRGGAAWSARVGDDAVRRRGAAGARRGRRARRGPASSTRRPAWR